MKMTSFVPSESMMVKIAAEAMCFLLPGVEVGGKEAKMFVNCFKLKPIYLLPVMRGE